MPVDAGFGEGFCVGLGEGAAVGEGLGLGVGGGLGEGVELGLGDSIMIGAGDSWLLRVVRAIETILAAAKGTISIRAISADIAQFLFYHLSL